MVSYYAIVPAHVRYAKIPDGAKLLYGEITALSSKEGFCWATNSYFAHLYDVNENTISSWIATLKEKAFVLTEIDQKHGNRRVIRIEGVSRKNGIGIPKNREHTTNIKSNSDLSKDKSSLSEFEEVAIDKDGDILEGKQKPPSANPLTVRAMRLFQSACEREVGIKAQDTIKGRAVIKRAMTRLKESDLKDYFAYWFSLSKTDQDLIQATQAFSTYAVDGYYAER